MLNQMGEINNFIKLILKLPVYSPLVAWLCFSAAVGTWTLKNVQKQQFDFRLFFFFIRFTSAETCLDSSAEEILIGSIWGRS